jgi:hypothetical protein
MLVLQPSISRVRLESWVGVEEEVDVGVDANVDVKVAVDVIVDVTVGVEVLVEVMVQVGVTEAAWVKVGEAGRIILGVAVGM